MKRDEDGRLHSEDGPAVEWSDGTKFWMQHDQYHRLDGPAIENVPGAEDEWYIRNRRLDPLEIFLLQGQIKNEN